MVIDIKDLCIEQGSFELRDLDLRIETGRYVVLMGCSGCGKTTIMEVICGLRRHKSGRIRLADTDVTRLRPGERSIGYVPQDGALFPTMTVREQVGFALRIRRYPEQQILERVHELADLLGIKHLLARKPFGLSGGETQRVAIGRALAVRPSILCLDEPLSALDDEARKEMIDLLSALRCEMPVTTLHITHHQNEAKSLADDLFMLKNGRLNRL